MNKNENAWSILFEKYQILDQVHENGKYVIKSEVINTLRESRLMTKFDHAANLPEIFRKNKLAILPISRGSYAIGDFEVYQKQNYSHSLKGKSVPFPEEIQSLNPRKIFSEGAAIHCAYLTGMLENIVGEKLSPTISGKMSTSDFDFSIRALKRPMPHILQVSNSQCEIDMGYEGKDSLVLIEAKNSLCEDFIIRQLYYPYRLWQRQISKKVIPIFLSFSNDTFHFFKYEFLDLYDYNSIQLISQYNFRIDSEKIILKDLRDLWERTLPTKENAFPFPQADKFERIVDLLSLLSQGEREKEFISENYDFDPRQTQYYSTAGKYLGLIESHGKNYALSVKGQNIMGCSFKQKYLGLAEAILSQDIFHQAFGYYLENDQAPSREWIFENMRKNQLENQVQNQLQNLQSESTLRRRAQTALAWVEWIYNLTGE